MTRCTDAMNTRLELFFGSGREVDPTSDPRASTAHNLAPVAVSDYFRESGTTWMSGSAKRKCDRALRPPCAKVGVDSIGRHCSHGLRIRASRVLMFSGMPAHI